MDKDPIIQNRDLVRTLQLRIEAILGPLLQGHSQLAHVGYPDHWNAGDPAIWLGTEAVLDRLGIRTSYQCDWRNYDRRVMAAAIGNGPVLIAGGGNLGDLWPNHQRLRERVLRDFPDNPVVQLPQSICFERPENLLAFQHACNWHPNFHILLRDHLSLRIAAEHLSVPLSMCPDMAFGLGSFERPIPPARDIVWLARTDKESAANPGAPRVSGIDLCDWINPGPGEQSDVTRARSYKQQIGSLFARWNADIERRADISEKLSACHQQLARLRVRRGARMLASGRVVITDRLHGHILCLLMDIPHVVLDNSYQKVSGAFHSWTSDSPIATLAQSPENAVDAATSLLTRMHNETGEFAP